MPRIMRSMNVISRCQSLYRAEKMGDALCGGHHSFVLAICRCPGRSQEELSKVLCLNKSTVARAITQLEEAGLVKREANPADKRELLVCPTEKMQAILPRVRQVTAEWNELISRGITEEEMAIFESVLCRMEQSARELTQGREEERGT